MEGCFLTHTPSLSSWKLHFYDNNYIIAYFDIIIVFSHYADDRKYSIILYYRTLINATFLGVKYYTYIEYYDCSFCQLIDIPRYCLITLILVILLFIFISLCNL